MGPAKRGVVSHFQPESGLAVAPSTSKWCWWTITSVQTGEIGTAQRGFKAERPSSTSHGKPRNTTGKGVMSATGSPLCATFLTRSCTNRGRHVISLRHPGILLRDSMTHVAETVRRAKAVRYATNHKINE